MVVMTISSALIKYLVEILLSIILLFNVGAYKIIWTELRRESKQREKEKDDLHSRIDGLQDGLSNLKNEVNNVKSHQRSVSETIYGSDKDDTNEGHLVETEKKTNEILEKVKESERKRQEEHQRVIEAIKILGDRVLDKNVNSFDDIVDDD